MKTDPVDDTIRFSEAGAAFEIFGPANDGTRMVAVTDAGGGLHGYEARSFLDACRHVDEWLDTHVGKDAPGRFAGFRFLIWDHEGGVIDERDIPTRADLLERFEDLAMHDDLAAVVDHMQCTGNLVLEVRNRAGDLLLDNRKEARLSFMLWNRGEGRYDLSLLDATMAGVDGGAPGAVPAP
jgi:hypothetical protein